MLICSDIIGGVTIWAGGECEQICERLLCCELQVSTFEAVEMLNVLKTVNECFVFEAYLLHISVNECYASICLHGLAHILNYSKHPQPICSTVNECYVR